MSLSANGRVPLLQRLDSLRFKLFIAIAGANAVLALGAYLIISRSFDQGLAEYLNRADEARLQPLLQQLASGHQARGDWSWLTEDRERWPQLLADTVGRRRQWREAVEQERAVPPAGAEAEERGADLPLEAPLSPPEEHRLTRHRAPPERLLTIDPRLMLFDADGRLLLGPRPMAALAARKPIMAAGRVVGYLGYVPRLKVVKSLEKVFAERQTRRFAVIAVGLLLLGLLVSAGLAHWLTRRIRGLAHGTAALIQGDYAARIAIHGHDELAQLGNDFNRLAATLEAARDARQQWIADIAHELRTPLAVLRGEIEALQDGIRPLGAPSLLSLAQEVAQLTRLVEDLNLLSLSDLGALSYRQQPLVLGEAVDDCLQSQRQLLREKGISLSCTLDRQLCVVADRERIAQVVRNLLQNTLRYTDAPGRLQVELKREGREACLVWQDSSPGVAVTDLPRLTERLFRVDASRSRLGGGSGLGLAIAKAIIDAHGGRMNASASPLGGLCWTLHLPLAEGVTQPKHGAAHE